MNSTKSTVNVKIDADVKERATQLLERMGIDQTTAIDMFYRQVIVEHKLPFQPVAEYRSSTSLPIDESIMDIIRRKNIPRKSVEVNAHGHIVVDKDKDSELYDWAVNG